MCKNKGIWVYNTDTNTCLLTCVEEIGFLSLEIGMHIIRFYDGYSLDLTLRPKEK